MQGSMALPSRKNFLARILPAQGQMRVPVTLFASELLAPSVEELQGLEQVAGLEGVEQVVALPDLHTKPHLETPSSTATAVRDGLILSLSSPSPGCGMALITTELEESDLTAERLDAFFQDFTRRLPLHRPRADALVDDVRPFLIQGAAAAIEQFQLNPDWLGHIEKGGNALAAIVPNVDPMLALRSIPEPFLELAAQEFGYIGRGNHFFEFQVVESILNEPVAAAWGVRPGQVTAMLHADSGRLGSFTGRLYAHRAKNNWRGRMIEMRYKTPFHLNQAQSLGDAYGRMNYFFTPRRHTFLPIGSPLARQALWGLALAANYAFANRLAITAQLHASLEAVWGSLSQQAKLLYDVSHNSIGPEDVQGEALWVHRHNASRALPPHHAALQDTPFAVTGQPLLLPGTNRTHSYLCVTRSGVERSLFSVDHGAGRSANRLGVNHPSPSFATRLYDYQQGHTSDLDHRTDDGLDEVLTVLTHSDLAWPVARLRPLATLKDLSR